MGWENVVAILLSGIHGGEKMLLAVAFLPVMTLKPGRADNSDTCNLLAAVLVFTQMLKCGFSWATEQILFIQFPVKKFLWIVIILSWFRIWKTQEGARWEISLPPHPTPRFPCRGSHQAKYITAQASTALSSPVSTLRILYLAFLLFLQIFLRDGPGCISS